MKNTIKGWVARDKDGRLLFYTDKPWKYEGKSWAVSEGDWMEIDKSWYPNVKWEDEEPTEVSFTMIDESELTHGKVVKMEEAPDDRTYCKEHCKGYQESGGKCYFGFNCSVKKEAEAEKKWIPKFKAGDLFTYNDTSNEAKLYTVKRLEQHGCVAGYWCEQFDAPTKGNLWFSSSEEKYMEPEMEKKQTMEISSTKEAEEIINFIKDCFNRCRIAFPGADWEYYEKAIEVLRPEYTSYQQGFNAGYEEGYLSRKRVEKEFVEEIKGYLDELKDVNIDEEE